ncbi:MAG: VanZ family protein [Hespellia sp.]|nr:VanZ family protein [Hespellia sp.]
MRIAGKILFASYLVFLVYFLIFSDWYGRSGEMSNYRYNLVLFKEIRRFWENQATLGTFAVFENLAGNILIFIPLGFFVPMASRYKSFFASLLCTFGLSLCVEIFQLITKVGSFDVDDLLLNTIGGIIGHLIFAIFYALRRAHVKGKNTRNKSSDKRKNSRGKERIY